MPSATKKRPPFELEPGEGKAHEMRETPEEEVREGSEEQEGEYPKKTRRKRSAKGARNTKAPMDGESCGCGAKKGAKCTCDGGCGYSKKMDSALTPQEYLAACDIGIQGRSRSYIRARLDTAARLDLKCGKGSIRPGQKCTKGAATTAPSIREHVAKGAGAGAALFGSLGAASGAIAGAALDPDTTPGSFGRLGNAAAAAIGGGISGAVQGGILGAGVGGVVGAVKKSTHNSNSNKAPMSTYIKRAKAVRRKAIRTKKPFVYNSY